RQDDSPMTAVKERIGIAIAGKDARRARRGRSWKNHGPLGHFGTEITGHGIIFHFVRIRIILDVDPRPALGQPSDVIAIDVAIVRGIEVTPYKASHDLIMRYTIALVGRGIGITLAVHRENGVVEAFNVAVVDLSSLHIHHENR